MTDIDDRIAAKTAELGRRLTAQELIELINDPGDGDDQEIVYEMDEDP